jgi:hypothetical protein
MSSEHGTVSQFPGFARLIVERGDPVSISTLYLSILYIRLHHVKGLKSNIITTLRNIGLKETDLYRAIRLLYELEKYIEEIKRNVDLLEKIEEEHYHRFSTALYTFIKSTDFSGVEKYIKAFIELERVCSYKTRKGSFKIWLSLFKPEDKMTINIISEALKTGFLVLVIPGTKEEGYHVVVPAPYRDMYIHSGIIKHIIASVLSDLGFKAEIDKKFPIGDSTVVIDVWATKEINKFEFRTYVSCEKWNSFMSKDDVNSEQAKIKQLPIKPHLKILVAKSIEENAKKTALDDGFIIIELGSREPSVEELHTIIRARIKSIFIGLIPDNIKRALQDLIQ